MLPSYRNQSIDLHSELTGLYMRAALALNRLSLRNIREAKFRDSLEFKNVSREFLSYFKMAFKNLELHL